MAVARNRRPNGLRISRAPASATLIDRESILQKRPILIAQQGRRLEPQMPTRHTPVRQKLP
jgi:hypothetical protein